MKNSWFTETEVYLLHELVTRLDRLARKHVLDPRGVTYPEFLVAMMVREMSEPTQGEVCDRLDMSKSLVSQRVAALMAKGFLAQRRESPDRRHARLALTPKGREALEEIYQMMATNASRLLSALGPSRREFHQALVFLQQALVAEEARVEEAARAAACHPGDREC